MLVLKRLLLVLALVVIAMPGMATAQVVIRLTVPEVRVRIAPPVPRVEVRPERPSSRHQWTSGHWAWRRSSHVWIAGTWTPPPRDGMVWEDARWSHRKGGWFYTEGHWRWDNQPNRADVYEPPEEREPVVVQERPPRNYVERRSARPFRGAVWITGYWHWNGDRYSWVAGRWSAPRQGQVWAPDRWTRDRGHGGAQRWVLARGHWQRRR
jgi:hypothetical protein